MLLITQLIPPSPPGKPHPVLDGRTGMGASAVKSARHRVRPCTRSGRLAAGHCPMGPPAELHSITDGFHSSSSIAQA